MRTYLVAAPHPLSNIRPVLYTGRVPSKRPQFDGPGHPYSLDEFTPVTGDGGRHEAWIAERHALDAMNHRFWSSVRVSLHLHQHIHIRTAE